MLDPLNQAEIDKEIAYLASLDDEDFAHDLADYVHDPDPVTAAAFRSPQVVQRSHRIIRLLINQANNRIEDAALALKRNPLDAVAAETKTRQVSHVNKLGAEQTALRQIVNAYRVSRGEDPTAPNPRGRAYRDLAKAHPVEYLALVRKHEEAIKAQAKAERKARRQERVEARNAPAQRATKPRMVR